jgi:mRNA interferase RelE/StbE
MGRLRAASARSAARRLGRRYLSVVLMPSTTSLTTLFPPGSKALKGGDVEDLHRIRLRSYRVIYEVWRKQVIVLVLKVGHRREVYR